MASKEWDTSRSPFQRHTWYPAILVKNVSIASDYSHHFIPIELPMNEVFNKIQDDDFPKADEVLDFLENYKTYRKPSKEKVMQIIFQLVHCYIFSSVKNN